MSSFQGEITLIFNALFQQWEMGLVVSWEKIVTTKLTFTCSPVWYRITMKLNFDLPQTSFSLRKWKLPAPLKDVAYTRAVFCNFQGCASPVKKSHCACLVWKSELFWSWCLKILEERPDNVNTSRLPWLCRIFTRSSGETTEKYLSLMILGLVFTGKKVSRRGGVVTGITAGGCWLRLLGGTGVDNCSPCLYPITCEAGAENAPSVMKDQLTEGLLHIRLLQQPFPSLYLLWASLNPLKQNIPISCIHGCEG